MSVVRGIQLGLGLGLIQKGISDPKHGAAVHIDGEVVWWGWDSSSVSVLMTAMCALTYKKPKVFRAFRAP